MDSQLLKLQHRPCSTRVRSSRREEHPATLADLYDPLSMPPELLRAHQRLDATVDKAYEASGGRKSYKSDAERVAFLFELYQRYTSLLPAAALARKQRGTRFASE